MTNNKWPAFITADLDTSTEEGSAEMMRRWETYDREMRALIAKGGVHQDEDGWWVHTTTSELIGPDPELERPSTDIELEKAIPFAEALPELAASIRRRGPQKAPTKALISLRLDKDVIDRFKASGPGWQSRINEALRKALAA